MKRIIAAIAALIICVGASAQDGLGIIAGFTSSQVNIKESFNTKSVAGFRAGLAYNIPIAAGFALQPEVVYNVKGSLVSDTSGKVSDFTTKMQYVEVPLQLQYNLDLMLLKPFVFVEPFVGYALSGDTWISGSSKEDFKFDGDNLLARLEYGFSAGAGLCLFDALQLSVKYFWNMEDPKNYFKDVKDGFDSRRSFDGLTFSVGFFF